MRMHDIKANVLKALIAPADVVLRRVLFNSQPPPVARVSADVEYGPDAEQRLDIVEPHREAQQRRGVAVRFISPRR